MLLVSGEMVTSTVAPGVATEMGVRRFDSPSHSGPRRADAQPS